MIRTYGDSLDPNGNVRARAWCEAVIQRIPNYLDSKDEDQTKSGSLISQENKQFGRRFLMTQFRWLHSDEI